MSFVDELIEICQTAVDDYPDDIDAATDQAIERAQQTEGYEEFVDTLVREAIRSRIHDVRHYRNVARKRQAREYGRPAKVVVGASKQVESAYASYYAYYIAGRSLGSIRGEELAEVAAGERAKAAGCVMNARILDALIPLVPPTRTVQESVSEKRLRTIFESVANPQGGRGFLQ